MQNPSIVKVYECPHCYSIETGTIRPQHCGICDLRIYFRRLIGWTL
jgi:rubrerythrin